MLNSEKEYYKRIASAFRDSVFLLLAGLVLSFSYIERVENALRSASGVHNYHIGLIAAQIYGESGKLAFFNWGFPFIVVLGAALIYFSILAKEMAEDAKGRASITGVS